MSNLSKGWKTLAIFPFNDKPVGVGESRLQNTVAFRLVVKLAGGPLRHRLVESRFSGEKFLLLAGGLYCPFVHTNKRVLASPRLLSD